MQPLSPQTTLRPHPPKSSITLDKTERCAELFLNTMPRVMRVVRLLMANGNHPTLTVPQFRTLLFVEHHAGASLSETAEFLGLALPSASRQVDHLVKRTLLARHQHDDDRRRITLRLTAKGNTLLTAAQAEVRQQLASRLGTLEDGELTVLERALGCLHQSFPPLGAESTTHSADRAATRTASAHRSSETP